MMLNSSSRQFVTLLLTFVIMGPSAPSSVSFVESKTDALTNVASQLAVCLHKAFEENTGFNHLHKVYDSLCCVNRDTDARQLLYNVTEPAAARLETSMRLLQDLSKKVQRRTSISHIVNVTQCCQENSNSSLTHFSERLHSSVDLTRGCSIRENSQDSENSFTLNSEILNGFQENFNKSSEVAWQYYGSINGEYLQYPANTRHCEGSTSQFDPRFKSWYVETASPVKKNLVIIIDRSGSMSGPRMQLAKDAALTVLDTLSPQDNVGMVAFSSSIRTPSGCFGSTVATGIPANLDILRNWLQKIFALGSTYYAPAFKHAFTMFENVTSHQSSGRSNIILFLTDGDPNDAEAGIYRAIEEGQFRMNRSVQINTYALGTGLSAKSLQRLRRIAYNNSGVFLEIKDQNSGGLKRIMGSYYTSIKTPLGQEPRLSLPHMDPGLGLKVTMSLALTQNGSFIGVVAMDLPLERLFKETLQLSSTSLSYAVLVDKEGRAILHPSLPGPSDVTSSRSFLPVRLFEPALSPDVILNITAGGSGQQSFQVKFLLPLGNQPTDGTRTLRTNATYMWKAVGRSAYYIVCVVANEKSLTTDLTSLQPSSQIVPSFYHRLDLSWNASISHPRDICGWKNNLISPTSSTVKIAPAAFNDSDKYIYSTETLIDVQDIQEFFNDHISQAKYKGLNEAIRAEVMLTSELEDVWHRAEFHNPDTVQWRFVGTQKGVLKTFPGIRLQKTYSHKNKPWFLQAASWPGKLGVSLQTSAYQQDTIVSLSKAVRKTSCQGMQLSDDQIGEVLAVMGMEMTQSAFLKLIADNVGLDNDTILDRFILDSSGYIMFNLSTPAVVQDHKTHLTVALPWLASELIRRERILKASWCNNYQQHTVELFYEFSGFNVATSNSTDPCRHFTVNSVPGTTLFLLGIPSRKIHHCTDNSITPQEDCSCGKTCGVCSSDVDLTCQCPCACQMPYDECHNTVTRLWTSTPCPVPSRPLFDTEKEEAVFKDALAAVPRCARDCLTISNMTKCEKTIGCHWCTFKAKPSCSSECRTGQSLSMVVLFPCNDFPSLSAGQRIRVKYLFKEKLRQLVSSLTELSLEILDLQKEGIAFKAHATSANRDLSSMRGNIERAVNQGKVKLGPAADLPKVYIAKSFKDVTDLHICLTLDGELPRASQAMREIIESELQPILIALLGRSLVSTIYRLNINKTSVRFALGNEGQTDLYPLQPFKERLEKAVKLAEISFKVPIVTKEASKKMTAVNISALSTFDFLCHPHLSTPTVETTTTFTREALETSSHSTLFVESTSATTGRGRHTSPTDQDRQPKQGLTPVETAVVVIASLVGASALPCILFVLLTRRRRPKTRKGRVFPEGGPDEDFPSEISELSEIDANLNIIVNRAYFMEEQTRVYRSPREAWARAKELTIPKHVPQGAWF